ncbi:TPA: LysM peptidoglycan-binding domain-containing protein [Pseudomonas aeruginosa]
MSSTQHQLIEQCATRLRGIVEALDNIHDNTPHRWSTDLDDVHSSAESLLALIKDQAPARSEASFEEWLANELEGEDGQPVPAAVCDIALARRAFNHWPKLEQPAKVGGVRFSAGVSSRLVVEAAQRLYEFESTPEQEAERIERLQAFREQLDPLNLAPHAKAFNEAPAEALKSEQAEAELEKQEPVGEVRESGGTLTAVIVRHSYATKLPVGTKLYAAPVAQAQHSVPAYVSYTTRPAESLAGIALRQLKDESRWVEIRDINAHTFPDMQSHSYYPAGTVIKLPAAAPGKEVPQAWLDVQAERRRQVEVEGYHGFRDSHYINYELSKAARAYIEVSWHALSGGLPCKKPESWPWMTGFKWADGRTMLVKAGALILAEIERLDRVAASQGGPSDA